MGKLTWRPAGEVTEPGWYWFREPGYVLDRPVELVVSDDGTRTLDFYTVCRDANTPGYQLAGPLTPPEVTDGQ